VESQHRFRRTPGRGSVDHASLATVYQPGVPDDLVKALLDVRSQVPVPVEFVARSHLPMLEYAAQVDLMEQLAEGVAPHV
jgi:hypothetical protein